MNRVGTMSELVGKGSKYTDEQRRQAVLEYAIYGSLTKVSKSMGIPRQTLSEWKRSADWWERVYGEIQHEKEQHILAQHTAIVTKVGEEIQDRLEHGDTQIVQGEKVKVPVKARDLALVGGISFDKRRLILNQPTSISAKTGSMDALMDQFRKLAEANQAKIVSEQ